MKGNPRLPQFFAKAPLSDAARKDLIRLHGKNPDYMAGMSGTRQARRAGQDELSGLSSQRREDESRCAAVFHRRRRPQQQASRHHAGARSGRARSGGLQRVGPRVRGAVQRGLLPVSFSRRQRIHRPAAGGQADPGGIAPAPVDGHHRGRATRLRQAGRSEFEDAHPPEQPRGACRTRRNTRSRDGGSNRVSQQWQNVRRSRALLHPGLLQRVDSRR